MSKAQTNLPALDAVDKGVKALANSALPFYRRWPYRGPVWWTEANLRGAISHEHRFFYNRLPKVANSSITGALVDAARAAGSTGVSASPKHFFARPSDLSRAKVSALAEDYFRFVFVRDPYSRTLSAFLDKIGNRQRQAKRPLAWCAKQGIDTPDFTDFCRYLDATGLYDDPHWAPQTSLLLMPLEEFHHVGRFETLDDDLATVMQRIFGTTLTADRRGPPSTGAAELAAAQYSDTTRGIVRRLFAEDFERLGYDADVA